MQSNTVASCPRAFDGRNQLPPVDTTRQHRQNLETLWSISFCDWFGSSILLYSVHWSRADKTQCSLNIREMSISTGSHCVTDHRPEYKGMHGDTTCLNRILGASFPHSRSNPSCWEECRRVLVHTFQACRAHYLHSSPSWYNAFWTARDFLSPQNWRMRSVYSA